MDTSGSVVTRFPSSVYDTKKTTCLAINVNKWQMYHNAAVWAQRVKKQVEVGLIYLLDRWGGGGGGADHRHHKYLQKTATHVASVTSENQHLLYLHVDISYSPRLSCIHNYYISTVQIFIYFFTSEWKRFCCCWRVRELLLLVLKDSFLTI